MNELLITQTQQTQTASKRPSGAKSPKGSGENEFERLMFSVSVSKAAGKSPQLKTEHGQRLSDEKPDLQADVPGVFIFPMTQMFQVTEIISGDITETLMDIGATYPADVNVFSGKPAQIDFSGSMTDTVEEISDAERSETPAAERPAGQDFTGFLPDEKADGPPETGANVSRDTGQTNGPEVPYAQENNETVRVEPMVEERLEQRLERSEDDRRNDRVDLRDLALKSLESGKETVKVSDSVNTEKPDFPERIAEKIVFADDGTAKRFDIELYPKELGRVSVSVVFEKGKAVVTLLCENARAQQILSSHAGGIRELVESHSRHETDIRVHKDGEGQAKREDADGNSGNRNSDQRQQDRRPKREEMSFFIDQLKMGILSQRI